MSNNTFLSDADSSFESDEKESGENEFIMELLREITKEGMSAKKIYKIFISKVISFMNKLSKYEADPLFTRIRDCIENMELDNLNIESNNIYKCAISQNKHLIMDQIEKYMDEEDSDTDDEDIADVVSDDDGSDDDGSDGDDSNQSIEMEEEDELNADDVEDIKAAYALIKQQRRGMNQPNPNKRSKMDF